jgi:hypothetical protein
MVLQQEGYALATFTNDNAQFFHRSIQIDSEKGKLLDVVTFKGIVSRFVTAFL